MRNNPTRRDFLKSTLATGVAASVPSVAFLSSPDIAAGAPLHSDDLTAHLIWSGSSVSIPVLREGHAVDIASSGNGHLPAESADLHSIFVKEFPFDGHADSASIRIFAYTRYRLYINGRYIGRGPSRYQNERPEYDTRAIRAALHRGLNRVAVLVHRDAPTGRIMRHQAGFAAVIELTQAGKTELIPTDPTWHSMPDRSFLPRNEAWASIEEHIDFRNSIDLNDPAFSIANWPASIPVSGPGFFPIWPRTTPLQSELPHSFPTVQSVLSQNRPILLPLNQVIQGYHLLEFEADAGSALEIRYLLPEGQTSGMSSCICHAGPQLWIGGDTFALDRISVELKAGKATLLSAEIVEVRYPFEVDAMFQCRDPFLNQLFQLCTHSLQVLSEDSYVDCADRERVEWTDDSPPAFDLTRVAMSGPKSTNPDGTSNPNWGDSRLLKALLRRIALTQQPGGQLKAHSCSERFDIHAIMEDRSCDWIILLREYYESSGDAELVLELWPNLTRLLQWFLDRRTIRGLVQAREWEVWDNPLRYQVCEGAGLNAFVYRALIDAAYLAQVTGNTPDAHSFTAAAESLQSAFNTLLWNSQDQAYDGALFGPTSKRAEQLNGILFPGPITGTWTDGRYHPTAQAALFALYCGIVPSDRLHLVRTWLLRHLDEVKGPMSHYYLFRALYELSTPRHDLEVLARMRTGWKAQVESPWQTSWEDLADNGGSKVHIYGIAPGSYLITHVLGVRRVGPVSDRRILIEPRPGDLTFARGIAVTEFGRVQMDWSISPAGVITIACQTPIGATLRLYRSGGNAQVQVDKQSLPAQVHGDFLEIPLDPGSYQITYPAPGS